MSAYAVTFAPTVAISLNPLPWRARSTLNPVSLSELSVQDRLTWLDDTAVAERFEGAPGVAIGVGVGVEVGVAVAVGVGVEVGLGVVAAVAVGLGVGVAVAVGVGVVVGVGVGVGVVAPIWTIFATEGTPFEFRMNSM